MNNVRYGRITASDEDVFEACKAACIHDKIKGFTHGEPMTQWLQPKRRADTSQVIRQESESEACEYQPEPCLISGADRISKLSGGELQRIAIARAMLKKPDIVLLDEATSAVDTDTEQQIQVSFKRLCQGRTTFIVA
jgi:ABC-type multidrug transport system fused ATPase/permease subunit